ncbi:MAG: sulfatase, partial [Gemmatimonadota bacterium]
MSHPRLKAGLVAVRPATDSGRLAAALAAPAAGAFAFGLLTIFALTALLHVVVDRSAWHMEMPQSFRWVLLAWAVTRAALLGVATGVIAALLTLRRQRLATASIMVLAILLFLWTTSWGLFWATGRFLDLDSFELAAASPGSMLMHVAQLAPLTLVLVPVGTAAVAVAIIAGARHMHRVPRLARGGLLVIVLAVFFGVDNFSRETGSILAGSELHIAHPEGGSGTRTRVGDLYEEMRSERSEPLAHLVSSLRRGALESEMSDNVEVRWPDQTPYSAKAPREPYNVIVLVIESLRSDELEAYGSMLPVMPAVDRLTRDAAVFRDHLAVATHSNYASVVPVSSQYPLRDERMHVYPEEPLYPRVLLYDVLKPLGYRTAIISSQDERWGGMSNFLASDRLDHFFHAETYDGPKYVAADDEGFARYVEQYNRSGKIDDRYTIDEAIRWIGADTTAAPFMVYVNLQNSHVPYPIPADAPTPFGPREASFPIRFNYFPEDSADVVHGMYRNALHYVDAQIGRLTDHLQQTGQWDRTIFVAVGDHGQAFFEHGFAAHSNELYDELLRTPLIIRAPGIAPGMYEGLVQQVDIAPTVLGLLGLPPHPGFQGLNLLSAQREFAYSIVQSPLANQFGIIQGPYKLVVDTRRHTAVLRNRAVDPLERYDLSARDSTRTRILRERLDTWRAAQLRFYTNPLLQAETYAPVLPEPRALAG